MRMVYKPDSAAIVSVMLTLVWVSAHAFTPQPSSWARYSPDGQIAVVMISPLGVAQELAGLAGEPGKRKRIAAIRDRFSQSGIYRNGETPELLWQLDSYYDPTYSNSTFVTNDGRYVAFVCVSRDPTYQGDALGSDEFARIYRDGVLTSSFSREKVYLSSSIDDTAKNLSLASKAIPDRVAFDEQNVKLFVWTGTGECIELDCISSVVNRLRWPNWARILLCVVGVVLAIVALAGVKMAKPSLSEEAEEKKGRGAL